ncbi:glycosyltransferase involved in cell wall biosynthesis [Roseiarcus fermentans]|uniref:Glycosyltransferase involved in cell wall biosynthesis n=1 Tax=Roseiarcus fermentans TaxID=1473586 RepID=A0A366EYA3_9HYPH|nr:glycosyltransferase [Roseiarcus fermentans]RBP07334.1 glycosyltransferase involved in cell wall biosynthesis [Roseiarcus fermentans]
MPTLVETPTISVVIPLYNMEATIIRAVSSICNQSRAVSEIIVVDDGSTDGGVQALQNCGKRIVLVSQSNSGVAAARNAGINHATGDYIAFLDADDEWSADFSATICNLISEDPDAFVFATNYQYVEPDGVINDSGVTAASFTKNELMSVEYLRFLWKGVYLFNSSSICVKRSAFASVGLFDTGLTIAEDIDMWVRLAQYGRFLYSPRVCSVYHRDDPYRSPKKDTYYQAIYYLEKTAGIEASWVGDPRGRAYLNLFITRCIYAHYADLYRYNGHSGKLSLRLRPYLTLFQRFKLALKKLPATTLRTALGAPCWDLKRPWERRVSSVGRCKRSTRI